MPDARRCKDRERFRDVAELRLEPVSKPTFNLLHIGSALVRLIGRGEFEVTLIFSARRRRTIQIVPPTVAKNQI
ncbi:MAG: hypothetical protein QOH65_1600 [Methylobacteriaceae bacterium]|jgi:hypothetical protein|nr:hypothetical protein [Methylobacteriaceae bacterium]